jgi:transcriptional regulator of heat shock response
MKDYKPFDGNQSITITDLTIENSADKVIIYGDMEITRDKTGLEKLNKLLELLEATKKQLELENLPYKLENKPSVIVNNPFKIT